MSPNTSPADETILTAEITFSKGDKVAMSDKDLEILVKDQILKTGLTKIRNLLKQALILKILFIQSKQKDLMKIFQ